MIGRLSAANHSPLGRRQVSGGEPRTDAHTRASGAPLKHALGWLPLWIYPRGGEEKIKGKRQEKMADLDAAPVKREGRRGRS